MLKCEVHENCNETVVAKVGLPGPHAKWVCQEGFDEYRGNPRCNSFIGGQDRPDSLRCQLRMGHDGVHVGANSVRWNYT